MSTPTAMVLSGRLSAGGHRLTPQRSLVAGALARAGRTVTAQELYARLRLDHPSLGRATVFRALDALVEAGLAQRLEGGAHGARYTACGETHHHHLLCRACGRSIDIGEEEVGDLLRLIRDRHGFQLDHGALDFAGICAECAPRP